MITYVTVKIQFELHDFDIETKEQAAELLTDIIDNDFIGELTADNIAEMHIVRSTLPPNAGE
jgi:hypothetical protein